MATSRFVKKARAEYYGYLLVEDDYVKESFRIIFENFRDLQEQVNTIQESVTDLETRVTALE